MQSSEKNIKGYLTHGIYRILEQVTVQQEQQSFHQKVRCIFRLIFR